MVLDESEDRRWNHAPEHYYLARIAYLIDNLFKHWQDFDKYLIPFTRDGQSVSTVVGPAQGKTNSYERVHIEDLDEEELWEARRALSASSKMMLGAMFNVQDMIEDAKDARQSPPSRD